MKKQIAIFASGTGTNAREIIKHSYNSNYEVILVVSNKKDAGVLNIAQENGIKAHIISKEAFFNSESVLEILSGIDFIVLAGFLWLIPKYLIKAFPNKIINISTRLYCPNMEVEACMGVMYMRRYLQTKKKRVA